MHETSPFRTRVLRAVLWLALLGAVPLRADDPRGSESDCRRLTAYLTAYRIGETITVVSKRGNKYTGELQGVVGDMAIVQEPGRARPTMLRLDRIDEDSIVPESYEPPPLPEAPVDEGPTALIAGIKDAGKRAAAQQLHEELPTERPDPREIGYGTLPRLGELRNFGAETLLFLDHPQLDPVLHQWLADTQTRFADIRDPLARARALTEHVVKTFRFGEGGFFNPIRRHRYQRLSTTFEVAVRLGDFIENGTGVCRHQAAALQLALQRAGISSRLVYGELEVRFLRDRTLADGGRHAWVIIDDGTGHEFLLDPAQGKQGPTGLAYFRAADRVAEDRRPRRLPGRQLFEDVIYEYHPKGYAGIESPQALDRSDFPDLVSLLTGR